MSNIMASFNTGVSGLQAAQSNLNLTAHNLANATTKGYSRQRAIITDHNYYGNPGKYNNLMQVGLGTDIAGIRQIRNQFLDDQYRIQIGRQSFYEAHANTMSEIEDLFGELNGEEFSIATSDLKGALKDLAGSPDDIVLRDKVVSCADSFIEKAQVVQDQLKKYQTNLNQEITKQIKKINTIGSQINDLNDKIRRYEVNGEIANDYRDARNQLLDELAAYAKYEKNEEMDGTVTVRMEGNFLVSQERAFSLTTAKVDDTTDMLKPVWADNGGGDLYPNDKLTYSMQTDTDMGSLKGLLIARGNRTTNYNDIPVKPDVAKYTNASGVVDQAAYNQALNNFETAKDQYNTYMSPSVIMKVQAQLDQMVHGMVTMINDTLCPNKELELSDGTKIKVLDEDKAPVGDDPDATMGTELFVRKSTSRYTKMTVDTPDGPKDVYKYNEEDPADPYSLYTINELQVNPKLLKNSSLLPLTSNPKSGYVDGYTMDTANAVAKTFNVQFASLDPNLLTKYTFSDYYTQMIGDLGTQGQVWNSIVSNQKNLTQNVDNSRQEEMGVSTDEELVSLIKFQHSFSASSRYINVINEMLEHLLTRLG